MLWRDGRGQGGRGMRVNVNECMNEFDVATGHIYSGTGQSTEANGAVKSEQGGKGGQADQVTSAERRA